MTSCANANVYLTNARTDFNKALMDTIADIKAQLYPSANFVIKQTGQFSYYEDALAGNPTTLAPDSIRLSELNPFAFEGKFGKGVAGTYNIKSGRIFVKEMNWCRHSLIHETLHSVSTFADLNNVKKGIAYPFINEGLTELLASYISWKRYPDCHKIWKNRPAFMKCLPSTGYHKIARIWYTFCRFIPFNAVNELYFNDRKIPWADQWANFLNSIADVGYTFNDPLAQQGQMILEDRFLFECKQSFGRNEVERIFEVESYDFDYDKLIII